MKLLGFTFLIFLLTSCTQPVSDTPIRVPYDPDLNGWRTASWAPFGMNDRIADFAFGNTANGGRYIAVSSTGVIAWSNNGDIWHRAAVETLGAHFAINAVAFGTPKGVPVFVAVGNGGLFAFSYDGKEWSVFPMGGGFENSDNIRGITWGGGMFVAVGDRARKAYSFDGIYWSDSRDSAFGTAQLNDIAFDPASGRFFIVGNGGNRGWSTAPSLGNWNHHGHNNPVGNEMGADNILRLTIGRYGNNTGIGVIHVRGGHRIPAIATTLDNFAGWDMDLEIEVGWAQNMNGITWGTTCNVTGNGNFVIAGTAAVIGFWPSDQPSVNAQRHWRALPFHEFIYWEITSVAALNGRFFVGGIAGRIGYSR